MNKYELYKILEEQTAIVGNNSVLLAQFVSRYKDTVLKDTAPPPPPPPPYGYVQSPPIVYPLNAAALLGFESAFGFGEAYDRKSKFVLPVVSGKTLNDALMAGRMINPIGQRPFGSDKYILSVDGIDVLEINPIDGAKKYSFSLPIDNLEHGYHILTARGFADETCIPMVFIVDRNIEHPKTLPQVSPTYDLRNRAWLSYVYSEVPTDRSPYTQTLPYRLTTPFSDTPPRSKLFERDIIPRDHGDNSGLRQTNSWIHSMNDQGYYFEGLESKWPGVPLLDGKRGEAPLAGPTHIHAGRTAIYVLQPWRLIRINGETGETYTLAGWKHKSKPAGKPAPGATDAQQREVLELRGKWQPGIKEGFEGAWGFTFYTPSLAVDTSVTIPNDGLGGKPENPHVIGPLGLVADTKNDRIVGLQFDAKSHQPEPYCYEFCTGLLDPWDIGCSELGEIIVNERRRHRVILLDSTGKYVRTLVETPNGDDFAYVSSNRVAKRKVSVDLIRQQKCVLPEGGFYYKRWWYYASNAMAQILRVHLDTGEVQVVVPATLWNDGTAFIKFTISDGSFGPEYSIFASFWTISGKGRPIAYLPNGASWGYNSANVSQYGPGMPWDSSPDYSSAAGIGTAGSCRPGCLIHGSSTFGLREISLALPTDLIITEKQWITAERAYEDAGYSLAYGEGGWNPYSSYQPWGISQDIDNYLLYRGHVKPS